MAQIESDPIIRLIGYSFGLTVGSPSSALSFGLTVDTSHSFGLDVLPLTAQSFGLTVDTGHSFGLTGEESPISFGLTVEPALSFGLTVEGPSSFGLTVDTGHSFGLDVLPLTGLSFGLTVGWPIYDHLYTISRPTSDPTTGQTYTLTLTLRPDLTPATPITVTPQLIDNRGNVVTATFSPATVTLSPSSPSATITVTPGTTGWTYFTTTHDLNGFLGATSLPLPLYVQLSSTAGTDTCSGAPGTTEAIRFTGSGRTSTRDKMSFRADVAITVGDYLTGSVDIQLGYGISIGVNLTGYPANFEARISVPGNQPVGSINTDLYRDAWYPVDYSGHYDPYGPRYWYPGLGDGSPILARGIWDQSTDNPPETFTIRASIYVDIEFDEWKGIDGQLSADGAGEPPARLSYFAKGVPGYTFSYSTNWSVDSPGFVLDTAPDCQPSGSFELGTLWQFFDANGVMFLDQSALYGNGGGDPRPGHPPPYSKRVVINPNDSRRVTSAGNIQINDTATLGVGLSGVAYSGSSQSNPNFSVSFSNVRFDSGEWEPLPYTGTDSIGHATLTVGKGFLSIAGSHAYGVASVKSAPKISVPLVGKLYQGEQLYQGNVDFLIRGRHLVATNGTLTATVPFQLSQYSASAFPGVPATVNDYQIPSEGMMVNLQGNGFIPANDPTVYWLDDVRWGVTTLTHAPTTQIEGFNLTGGWSVTGGTKANNTSMVVTASDAGCSVSSPFSWNYDCRAYRYLRIDTDHTDGTFSPLSLSIGGKTFTSSPFKSDQSWVEFDLCKPDDANPVSMTRTGWDVSPDDLYGVFMSGQIHLSGFPVSHALTLNSISLVRHGESIKGRALPEYMPGSGYTFEPEWYPPDVPVTNDDAPYDVLSPIDGGNHKLYGRVIAARVDGKQIDVWPHAIQMPSFLNPYTLLPWDMVLHQDRRPIAGLIRRANLTPGISMTPGVSMPQPVDGNGLPIYSPCAPAAFLTLNPSPLQFAGCDVDLTNSVTITAQPIYPYISYYPGQRVNTSLRFCKVVGGLVEGLVVGSGNMAGLTVTGQATTGGGSTYSATTDADGYFRFGALTQGKRQQIATTKASALSWLISRRWRWLGLAGGVSGLFNPWNLEDAWGRYHRVCVLEGNVTYWRSDGPFPTWNVGPLTVTHGGTDSYPRIAQTADGWVYLLFVRDGTDTYRSVSYDDGQTWSDPEMSITGGVRCTNAVGTDGTYVEVAVVTQGGINTLMARTQGSGDISLSDAYPLVDEDNNALSVEIDTFHLSHSRSSCSVWLLCVTIAGESAPSDWYSADLTTWKRLPTS